ncbi:hypothetical protein [Miniimonas sp. S16]|uniref:hypothetical protein n=1 Tax=Miniimonas sp. S16 TaxID=2171623 RepID=UPI00131F420D|nr:hypothetical protein [Miniimonas sp. S16]
MPKGGPTKGRTVYLAQDSTIVANYFRIRESIANIPDFSDLAYGRHPARFSQLLSSIVLGAGESPFTLVTTNGEVATNGPQTMNLHGLAFTDALVVEFTIGDVQLSANEGRGRVTVRRLSDMESFDVWSSGPIATTGWPFDVEGILRFRDGHSWLFTVHGVGVVA